jgi:leucyl aminopeptidase
VIDVATLTGSAEIIAGSQALAAMGNSLENLQKLKQMVMKFTNE